MSVAAGEATSTLSTNMSTLYAWFFHLMQNLTNTSFYFGSFIMAARLADGHSVLPLSFTSLVVFFFSPPNLRGRLADHYQTLPYVRW